MAKLGIDQNNFDNLLAMGFGIGLMSMPVLGWLGNFLKEKEYDSIINVAKDIKNEVTNHSNSEGQS